MKSTIKSRIIISTICFFFLLVIFSSYQSALAQENIEPAKLPPVIITDIKPEKPIDSSLKQGLSVIYYLDFFKRDLNYINQMRAGEFESFQGKPITHLNHQFGKNEVFDSGTSRGVAMRMKGFFLFPEKGQYTLQALSNDGIFLYLSEKLVISDPKQHSDRLSQPANITIVEAGWYSVQIDYFQRKGTAALKLFWKTPTGTDFVPVPASSYAH